MFEFYKAVYGGTKIRDELYFAQLEYNAKRTVLRHVRSESQLNFEDEDVKKGLCALCDVLMDKDEYEFLAREDWDSFSKTYREVDWNIRIKETIELFFPPELLYRGVTA